MFYLYQIIFKMYNFIIKFIFFQKIYTMLTRIGIKIFDEIISLGYKLRFPFDSIIGSLLICVERDLGKG